MKKQIQLISLCLLVLISLSFAINSDPITLTKFRLADIPDSLSGCSCLFATSESDYENDQFIYFDDIGDNCVISVDQEIIVLKPHGDGYSDRKLKVLIQNKNEIGSGYESTEYKAELIIIDHLDNTKMLQVYGICGC